MGATFGALLLACACPSSANLICAFAEVQCVKLPLPEHSLLETVDAQRILGLLMPIRHTAWQAVLQQVCKSLKGTRM